MKRASAPWLVAIVGTSFLLRMAIGWLRATPVFFPDEYIYAALGRSFADSGQPLIRDGAAHFPALLQPLVTAPVWLISDVDLAYRVVQAIGALTMSLAAVPVFLLSRQLGLRPRIALALSAAAVLVPDLVYASYISSEAFAYPLVLTAVYAATRALARPAPRTQVGFVVAAGLAILARFQFVSLPLVFALATLAVGMVERRVKAALREQALPLGLLLLAAGALIGAGPSRALGVYHGLLHFHVAPIAIGRWTILDAMMLAYASGWIVVPGALLGVSLALARHRCRTELAFGATVALLATSLFLEAGFLQAGLSAGKEIQERYVFYLAPLLGICFALYAARGWPLRILHLALAAALVVVSVRVPLSGYAISATVDGSPILYGVHWLTGRLGRPGDAAGLVAVAVGTLSVLAVIASRRPRLGTPAVLGLALLATGTASAGAVAFEINNAAIQKKTFLPTDPSWVDRAHVGRTLLLQSAGGIRAASLQELFWNRSVEGVLLLPGATRFDVFNVQRVAVREDGSLFADGQPVTEPLLVDGFGSTVRLRGAQMLEAGKTAALWVPAGRMRLSLYAVGRYHDGWLADRGAVYLWPKTERAGLSGWLSMTLTAPRSSGQLTLRFELPGGEHTALRLKQGVPRRLKLAVCSNSDWYATFRSSNFEIAPGPRRVSVRATVPLFTPSPSACPSRKAAHESSVHAAVPIRTPWSSRSVRAPARF